MLWMVVVVVPHYILYYLDSFAIKQVMQRNATYYTRVWIKQTKKKKI